MTAAVQPPASPGTDVAPRRAVGVLPPEIQAALSMRKMRNQVAAQIAGLSWGEAIDEETRRAVADWGQLFRIDVITEINILGNKIYTNAAFYLRRLGELIADDLVEYAVADHVEDDPRLKELGPEGEGEYTRRLRERILHAVPDKAASAVVFRVKLRSMDKEVVGTKWCGNGTRKRDPVGDDFPVETSESRAARRCMRLLVSHVPKEIQADIGAIEASAEMMSARIAESKLRVKAHIAQQEEFNKPAPMLAAPSDPTDPYSLGAEKAAPEPVPVSEPVKEPVAEVKAEAKPTPAPKPVTLEDLAAGVRKLIANPRLAPSEKADFEKMLTQADTEEKLRYLIGELDSRLTLGF